MGTWVRILRAGPTSAKRCLMLRAAMHAYNVRYNHQGIAPMKLKITTIGNSAGLILPKELLARLRVDKGDELYVLETPDGIKLTAFDPELAAQMEVAEEVMRKRRTLLHKLAQ